MHRVYYPPPVATPRQLVDKLGFTHYKPGFSLLDELYITDEARHAPGVGEGGGGGGMECLP